MRQGIQPPYGPVASCGRAAGHAFLARSTMTGEKTALREAGTARVLDTAGRVERFERRYGRRG